jgi:DNA replication protein DnaC
MSNNIELLILYRVTDVGVVTYSYEEDDHLTRLFLKDDKVTLDRDEAFKIAREVKREYELNKPKTLANFSQYKITDMTSKQIRVMLNDYLKNENWKKRYNGLFLIGDTGVGKTFALECLASELIGLGFRVLFKNVTSIIDEVKSTFNDINKHEDEVIGKYQKVSFLFIDDFGAERDNDFSKNLIYKIIDYRYNHKVPIFISSNYSLEDLNSDDISTKRIISRLKDR